MTDKTALTVYCIEINGKIEPGAGAWLSAGMAAQHIIDAYIEKPTFDMATRWQKTDDGGAKCTIYQNVKPAQALFEDYTGPETISGFLRVKILPVRLNTEIPQMKVGWPERVTHEPDMP